VARRSLIAALLAALVAGGGLGAAHAESARKTAAKTIRVYFLLHGKVQPVARNLPVATNVLAQALQQLSRGPSATERQLGLTTGWRNVPPPGSIASTKGVPTVTTAALPRPYLAQVVYTLSPFSRTGVVAVNGHRYRRGDFEDLTPAILVESPLPFQRVPSPIHASGTANTFEAVFQVELTDPEGKIVVSRTVHATSGTGTRGTFRFTVPYTVGRSGLGELVVFERSAKDGSRIHLVEIPVWLTRP